MHLTKTFSPVCLSTSTLSFKIHAFSEDDCKGDAQEINVWDNTRRDTNVPRTRSFRVLAYGAHRQRATFSKYNFCSDALPEEHKNWWADGWSDTFLKDACITSGYGPRAYGSHSA
ncbi:hypothetical protein N7467_007171 [Penicillium canescens]|nr:hypothetical protein N7467_007171 [Penicillium canescens]